MFRTAHNDKEHNIECKRYSFGVLAMQVLVKTDLSTPAFAQGMTSKLQFGGRN
jgi:hypothetical protein